MQTRLWLATKEYFELVSQDQILERKILTGTTAINKDAKQHQEEAQHRRGRYQGRARQGVHDSDRLLPPSAGRDNLAQGSRRNRPAQSR